MKYSNKLLFSALFASVSLIGCREYDPVPLDNGPQLTPTYSIAQLKQEFALSDGLFTTDPIVSAEPVIIKGVVTSDNTDNNCYKYIMIQDSLGDAIKVGIDGSGVGKTYPVGQTLTMTCNGLIIGNYADMLQIGVKYYRDDKARFEPGRIPIAMAQKALHAPGLPDVSNIEIATMTIPEIMAAGPAAYGRIVRIEDVHFTLQGLDFGKPVNLPYDDQIFAPSTGGIGFPQSRVIADRNGNFVVIATSEYASFSNVRLPSPDKWGYIIALVGWYQDKPQYAGSYQLTIRTLKDLDPSFGL